MESLEREPGELESLAKAVLGSLSRSTAGGSLEEVLEGALQRMSPDDSPAEHG